MEQWRQCGRWLIDCKVLPPNHRVVWPSAVVFDLAQALRDGVLLCQLLHNLSPGSIDLKDINFRPQMSQVRVWTRREGPWAPVTRTTERRGRGYGRPGTLVGALGWGRRWAVGRAGEEGARPRPSSRLRATTPGGTKLAKVPQAWGASPPRADTAPRLSRFPSPLPGLEGISSPVGRRALPPRSGAWALRPCECPCRLRAGCRTGGCAWAAVWASRLELGPVEGERGAYGARRGGGPPDGPSRWTGRRPLALLQDLSREGASGALNAVAEPTSFLHHLPSGPQVWPLSLRRHPCGCRAGQENVRSHGPSSFSCPLKGNLAES